MEKIVLEKEDCYCKLSTFYGNVAMRAGLEAAQEDKYDCRKICVTKKVRDEMIAFYMNEMQADKMSVFMMLLNYGPKAGIEGDNYAAAIEEGFVCSGEKPVFSASESV